MRCFWLFCLLTGCDFAASAPSSSGNDDQGQGQGQGGVDAGTGAKPPCDVAGDPSLQLCLTFDHDPMVQDLSSAAHPVTIADGVTRLDRNSVPSAISLTGASKVRFADDAKFDVAQLTIDMWIAPAPGATIQHNWLLDNNKQYFLTYELDGKVRCGISDKVVTSDVAVPGTGWHHVACTFGTNRDLRVYVDGDRSGCLHVDMAIPTDGTDGIAIGANYSGSTGTFGEHYVGGVDAVHVYGRALTDDQVCAVAGRSNCRAVSCDQGDGGRPGGGRG
jgi:hypothetical protein